MLKTRLLHPEILDALARNGHGARILIADGNYPSTTCAPPDARRVYLNFSPGVLGVVDVLSVLVDVVPFESALLMQPPDGPPPDIHDEFRSLLGEGFPLTPLKRFDFYERARERDTCLVIATAEKRRFANLLLTIGVVK